ncbi:hypothetical protein F0562_024855 [Nyssa sinensis]|uniref:Uncharacterized protein n=1 Tax=Nyssa sinensis TaxID=561372 RepID=A0A5J5BGZ1_9ASTE|nr:hypothetical protein F0562_024855 [Nyssa sinensis]
MFPPLISEQIILISSSQLFLRRLQNEVIRDHACCSAVSEKQAIAASFMAHFMADQACSSNISHGSLLHYELVRLFLDCCSPQDLAEMRSDLEKYFGYFIGLDEGGYLGFFENIDGMCMFKCILGCFENLAKDKRELEYPLPETERASNAEIFDMGERLDTCIGQYTVQNAFKELSKQRREAYDESISLSGSELEEHEGNMPGSNCTV